MIDFKNGKSYCEPFPHIILENCFEESILNKLINEFPNIDESIGKEHGGRFLIRDKNFSNDEWVKGSSTWKMFYDWLNNNDTFHDIIGNYKLDLKLWGSVINEKSSLGQDCYLYMDWSTSRDGYKREIHTDLGKRIWNFLIFFSDKDWKGGDFLIHESDELKHYPRQVRKKLPIYKTIEAKKNLGIFFLSTPNSYHSVSLQSQTKSPRNFIYGSYTHKMGEVFKKRSKNEN